MASAQDSEQLINDFNSWHRQYSAALSRSKSGRICIYSPAYDQEFDQLWDSLAGLGGRRDPIGNVCQDQESLPQWLEDIKHVGEKKTTTRRQRYSTWEEDSPDWEACPLWLHLCRLDDSVTQINQDGWRRPEFPWLFTMEYWVKFQELMTNEAFRTSLSPPQQCSFQVLNDWWNSSYSDVSLIEAVQSFLERRKNTSYADGGYEDFMDLSACRESSDAIILTKANVSLYHSSCFHLFLREFHPSFWEPYQVDLCFIYLQGVRFYAGSHAVAQRVAYTAMGLSHDGLDQATAPYCWPRLNFNSWFDIQGNKRPYFLWSIQEKRTIIVADLDCCPAYTCVSHTWGRWRIPHAPGVDAEAFVEGVPWLVPRNTLYDVCALPEMFLKLGDNTDYLWFDLVCIPQDGSRRADIEISRQSDIFRGAATCVAWFHTVESWEGMLGALEWRALGFLQTTMRDYGAIYPEADEKVEEAAAAAQRGIALMETDGSDLDVPSPWFTSLWTLQETIMRPDLQLYSRGWQRLEDKKGVAIPLHALFMIIHATSDCITTYEPLDVCMMDPVAYRDALRRNRGEYPQIRSSTQLYDLARICHIDSIITSPTVFEVLELASSRQCTDQRAPGIMSALQCTDWYVEKIGSNDENQHQTMVTGDSNIVLGMFPHEFVNELFQKFGPELFLGANFMHRRLKIRDLEQPTACGSMLPFFHDSYTYHVRSHLSTVYMPSRDLKRHDSIDGWEICVDGAVKMMKAGIVASTEVPRPTANGSSKIGVSLIWRGSYYQSPGVPSSTVDPLEIQDLEAWMNTASYPEDEFYAVVLCDDTGGMQGVLLHAPKPQKTSADTPKYLIKVGVWFTLQESEYIVPGSTDVNWIVL